jgi:hypothetical protein
MRTRIIEISNSQANIQDYGRLTWGNLNIKLQDIAVDLIYRGDYTSASRRFFQAPFVENNIETIKDLISDAHKWSSVPPDRFNKRKTYILE